MPAENAACALAQLGIVGAADRLIVFADDFEPAFKKYFDSGVLEFVSEPTPEAFVEATLAEPRMAGEAVHWFVNSIGGFGLRVPDLRALGAAAVENKASFLVDNTVASYFGCKPLMQCNAVCFEALDRIGAGRLAEKLVAVGSMNAHEVDFELSAACEAALQEGMDTALARLQQHFDHARALAEYLNANEMVPQVCYPGLKNHQDHDVATRVLMHGFGPAVDFELPQGLTSEAFIARLPQEFRSAPAGGAATRVSALRGMDKNYIRLFAGLEEPINVADSLDQALRWFCNPPEP